MVTPAAARLVAAGLTLWSALACAGAHARDVPNGTSAMVDTLAAFVQAARRNPGANAFLNRERLTALRAQLRIPGASHYLGLRFVAANEQLAAGDTRGAIAALDSVLRDANLTPDRMTADNRGVYDLLGIAWLRLAEQENCLANPAASVCILPLDKAARHRHEEGARNAVAVYEDILRKFPEDYGSRWLLNIAYLALGAYPRDVPSAYLIPGLDYRDTTAGAFPRFYDVAGNVGLAVNGLAGGVSIADFNGDGLLDVFKTSWGLNDPVHLLLADGKGGFVDRTAAAELTGLVGGLNTVHADYNNDGFEDVLILRGAWLDDAGALPMSLLRNRGDGTFEDVTFAAGLGSRAPRNTAAWGDFNLDGNLDLFVGNESSIAMGGTSRPSELFLNNGDGTFTDVAHQVGIDLDAFVKGAVWTDVNNDGLPDLYVSVFDGDNHLFLNRGGTTPRDWRFDDITVRAGVQRPFASFATWSWDYDNDGWEDLLVLSYDLTPGGLQDAVAREYLGLTPAVRRPTGDMHVIEPTRLYRNNHNNTFTDVSDRVGLTGKAIYAMGANFGDLDNDGWLDFYVGTGNPDFRSLIPNRMFRSVAGRRFEEVTLQGGFGHLQKGHGTAFADFDRDGDEDIFMVMGGAYQADSFRSVLFENPGWPGRNWVTLELEGGARPGHAATAANRSAIGARVHLVVDSSGVLRDLYRTVNTGGSFGAGPLQLHVGLGGATRIRELRIQWPDAARSTSTFSDVAVNTVYHLSQGGALLALNRPPVPFRASP